MDEKLLEKLDIFLKKKSNKKKIIVIYGPTASWKTDLSVSLAKKLNTEIISTDSRQIFKEMDIATAKITKEEMQGVKHHMIDIIYPDQKYSIWEYKKKALEIMNNIINKWKIPILCWGTGLYIDSLIYDFQIPRIPENLELRKDLEIQAKKYWKKYVYNKLLEIDKEYALELHPNNLQYVIRALEVKLISWKSKKDFRTEKKLKYDIFFISPYKDNKENRKILYERINERVDLMIEKWLIQETQNLLKKYKKNSFWLKTIWYSEIVSYLDWEISKEQAIELIKKNSRNYAKRQLTWFRKYNF